MCVYLVAMMCAGRFGLGWAHDVFKFACHMFMHFSFICTFIYLYCDFDLCWCFPACFSLSLSLSFFRLVALWHQNENPLRPKTLFCSGASSSSDTTPSHVRFSEDKARKDFSKNFSWQGIHSECQVILSDFSDTDLPTVIYTWGWESLCGISVTCAFVII